MRAAAIALFLSSFAAHARAGEFACKDCNFAITFPSSKGWSKVDVDRTTPFTSIVLSTANRHQRELLILMLLDADVSVKDAGFLRGLRTGFAKRLSGMTLVSDAPTSFAGVPAEKMVFSGEGPLIDGPARVTTISFSASGHIFEVLSVGPDHTSRSPELEKCLESFRFLKKPVVPPDPPLPHPLSTALGTLLGVAAVIFFLVLLFGVPVLLGRSIRRRRDRRAALRDAGED